MRFASHRVFAEAVRCLRLATDAFAEDGHFTLAAKYFKEMGELFECERNHEAALLAYQKAADFYDGENATRQASARVAYLTPPSVRQRCAAVPTKGGAVVGGPGTVRESDGDLRERGSRIAESCAAAMERERSFPARLSLLPGFAGRRLGQEIAGALPGAGSAVLGPTRM